ncbi:hypothetical protein, conserved [Angomonas deanei]|uniref:Uncharacterized protein n=1 Tax=Angomonas deanei TaxID=59799 RepID=A0A7G2CFC1_9TRYP|nr:hypothetical protein, conserved [Angomonas deanei]
MKSPTSRHEPGDMVHVQVNLTPEVIQPSGSAVKEPCSPTPTTAGEVANALADTALPGDALPDLRPLFLNLAAKVLSAKPKDPEQYIVDHLMGRQLSSQTSSPVFKAKEPEVTDLRDVNADAVDLGGPSPKGRKAVSLLSFEPVGDTVVDRLVFGLPAGPAKSVVTNLAHLLLDSKPEDPEDFLCMHLCAVHSAYSGAPTTIVAEDPTIASLLCDIPAGTPGYNVAMQLLPTLLAKRPTNPINYLFDHLSSRMSRGSAAQSLRSSNRRHHGVDCGVQSCSSSEFLEDEVDSTVLGDLTVQQRAAVDGYLASLLSRNDNNNNNNAASNNCGSSHANSESRRHRKSNRRRASDPNSGMLVYSPYTATYKEALYKGGSPLSPEQQQDMLFTIRAEFEMFKKREELRRDRLLLEIQALQHEANYRAQVAQVDGGAHTRECARAASAALAEAESYLVVIQSQLACIPVELEKQTRQLSIALNRNPVDCTAAGRPTTTAHTYGPIETAVRGNSPLSPQGYTDTLQQLNALRTKVDELYSRSSSYYPNHPGQWPSAQSTTQFQDYMKKP